MNDIEITKAKIKDGFFLNYTYIEHKGDVQDLVSINSTVPIHPDLEKAFQKMVPHFLLLTEQGPTRELEECIELEMEIREALLSKYKVTGFSIGGSDEHEGVTLIGQKILKSRKVINLNSPFQKFEEEHNPYLFERVFIHDMEGLKAEVMEYMKGKQADDPQTSISFEEDKKGLKAV